ncbi:MAG: 50S ribosomal protein L9 [Pseudomonadota bacterium]
MQTQVILLERIEKLGQMGDVVSVKPGYARNFLLPQRKALRATKDNISQFETQRVQLEAENLKRRDEAEAVAKSLEGMSVVLIRQAGDNGQLYGSVNSRDLALSIKEAGVTVDRKQVTLEKVIKVLGLHPVKVRLHPEVAVEVTANVARSEAEAEAQASTGHMVSADEQRETEEELIESVIAEVEEIEAEEAEAEAAATEADEAEEEKPAETST